MALLNNSRLAWGVAIAALALWATGAPQTFGSVLGFADDQQTPTGDATQTIPCLPVAPLSVTAVPAPQAAVPSDAASSGAFHLCGPDPQAAAEIEQLIAGRGFSASLSARGDGCADLTIHANPQSVGGGSASSHLVVSLGSGQSLNLQITSQGGATHVSIGEDHP